MQPYSLYFHIPFCAHRCSYCDFNTYAGLESMIPAYVHKLVDEIEWLKRSTGGVLPVHTIFFGGGTPSLLSLELLTEVVQTIQASFVFQPDIEITIEANPGMPSWLTQTVLQGYIDLGINRLSLGMQSAHPRELRLLDRQHNFTDVIQLVEWARQAGFKNLNLDLIFGLPAQSLVEWRSSLELALQLQPEHFSIYSLTLEHGTPIQSWIMRGLLPEPDQDLAADMYEIAMERLEQAGYQQYEISNWARLDGQGNLRSCRHNLQYWRNLPYLGLGAGAHGFTGDYRTVNVLSPVDYIQRLSIGYGDTQWAIDGIDSHPGFPWTPATIEMNPIDIQTAMGETMMMGLRLVEEGVSESDFKLRFRRSLREVYAQEIQQLLGLGLIEWSGVAQDHLRLTPRGLLLGNQVFMHFV